MPTNQERQYLESAADCVRLAAQISDPTRKLLLIDIAATWMRLAEQAQKNGRTDLVYETPLPSQDGPAPKGH